jgi:hypothetical protein
MRHSGTENEGGPFVLNCVYGLKENRGKGAGKRILLVLKRKALRWGYYTLYPMGTAH